MTTHNDSNEPTITHVLAVIDRSGSMINLATDVIGGYNGYLDSLGQDGVDYHITCALFNTEVSLINADIPVATALRLTRDHGPGHYFACGCTALLDAVGTIIASFESIHPVLSVNEKVILVIFTDGEENSSREYSLSAINAMIDERVATGKWISLYLGAGPSAWHQGSMFSGSTQVVHTQNTSKGTADSYRGLSAASTVYSASGDALLTAGILRDAVTDEES